MAEFQEQIPDSRDPHRTMRPENRQNESQPMENRNIFYLVFAYTCVGLGVIGAFLPVLPTTPFLLLAVWAAPKGSPSLYRWLYEHPKFGAALIAWKNKRAISTPAKWTACIFMTVSWVIMLLQTSTWVVPVITGILFLCVAAFLISRPTP